MQETQIIPFTEVQVPDNWNYDESVKKVRPMVQKWTDMSYEFFLELKIAKKILVKSPEEAAQMRWTENLIQRTWSQYCEDIGMGQRYANKLIKEYFEDPFLYNIWNMPRGDDEEYFGHFPYRFMRNLLYYHTQENDLIYDPFAGSGVTIDVCQEMNRRYYCSDLFPQKEKIKQWDIAFGLPEDFEKPDFVFLDPPYWKQAEGKYSDDERDLGNVSLVDFYKILTDFFLLLKEKGIPRIALLISPTQWRNPNHVFEHHWPEFHVLLHDKYRIEMEYSLPYSTQQYNGTQVNIAKQEKIALILTRSMIVWVLK